jgi:pimeloyl-ACP methyl ester carboxylesterase
MPHAKLDGLDLYYSDIGRHDLRPHAKTFTTAGYRIIVPDLRGYGRTGNPGGVEAMNFHQFASDVGQLCRFLASGAPALRLQRRPGPSALVGGR